MSNIITEWNGYIDTQIGELDPDTDTSKKLIDIKNLLKNQIDREYCSFEFRNNLANNLKIDYLKITHILEGREAFVYEAEKIRNGGRFYINDYAIGINLNNNDKAFIVKSEEVDQDKNKKKDKDNAYDRLFVHFIIDGQLYHHSYDQFFNDEILDLFSTDGGLKREYLSLLDIKLSFDPLHNDPNKSDFKLIFSVTTPLKNTIDLVKHKNI